MADAEYAVAKTDELADGQMKEVAAGDTALLLARVDGNYHATGAKCPHYGTSLADGVLCGKRVICPWHKAGFDVTTGKLLDPPALDGLTSYPVTVREGQVFVSLSSQPSARTPKAPKADARHFVIVGAGAAGIAAAEALRELGFAGRVSVITGEPEPPYDRTMLSKEFLSGNAAADQLPLRPPEFFNKLNIEVVHKHVAEIYAERPEVECDDGTVITYDAALLALGGIPRPLEVPGAGLGNVMMLRTQADAERILAAIRPGIRAAVVGGSFIGLEVASCFAMRHIPVTVIMPEAAPFGRQFGAEVGRAFGQWHEQHGVVFRLGLSVERMAGTGMVREVVLQSGERLPADLVVVGSGVRPATDPLRGFPLREDGGLEVDEFLCVRGNLYAAGDIAVFPDRYSKRRVRIEHWRIAEQHGRTAAANMLGKRERFAGVPYFWTNHFGIRFDYVGHAEQWSDVIIDGDLEKPAFIAYYVDGGRIVAAAACQRDLEVAALEELFRQKRVPGSDEIRRGVNLVSLAQDRRQAALA